MVLPSIFELQVMVKLKKLSLNQLMALMSNYEKAAGPDNLPQGFLKDFFVIIAKPLVHVINLSIATGIITPVYKSGPENDMDNYRPINVLPVCSKTFEQYICKRLTDFLKSNNLLSNQQFGFRSNRDTESAVVLFIDHIRKSMNDGKLTDSIFIVYK